MSSEPSKFINQRIGTAEFSDLAEKPIFKFRIMKHRKYLEFIKGGKSYALEVVGTEKALNNLVRSLEASKDVESWIMSDKKYGFYTGDPGDEHDEIREDSI